jgi:signal transduction histidine kinase
VLPEDVETLKQNLENRLRGASDSGADYHVVKKTGEVAIVTVHSSVILRGEAVVGLRGVLVDVTENRRVQELADRARRLETAGRVAGQVAHDFNNLLGPLMAYPELISSTLPGNHPAQKYAAAMLEAAQQLSEISQQLLTLGRRGHYELEPLSLNDIAKHVVTHLSPCPPELRVELDLATDLMPVLGGAAQLMRVASNLVANARQAMADRGQLSVRTENVYIERVTSGELQVPQGEYARLSVTDTGHGIAEEHRHRIFDPFFTTKRKSLSHGSGLGLSAVHAVVEDHGGYLDFESEVGVGTTFHVYLPVAREKTPVPDVEPDDIAGDGSSVLVVDDDPTQREVARQLLEALGYRVRVACGGNEALQQLSEEPPDVLVLDMVMPDVDGTETFRRARERRPEQRAILISGYAESDRVDEARRLGIRQFVRKPLTLQALGRALRLELKR